MTDASLQIRKDKSRTLFGTLLDSVLPQDLAHKNIFQFPSHQSAEALFTQKILCLPPKFSTPTIDTSGHVTSPITLSFHNCFVDSPRYHNLLTSNFTFSSVIS